MKQSVMAVTLGFTLLLAGAAQAAAPSPGTYSSADVPGGGTVETGRGSQSWSGPFNAGNGNGDVFNSQSWNGAVLGGQWQMGCGVSVSNQTVVDTRNGLGNGQVVYTTTFTGGTFFLSKNGPWGDGINDLTGVLSTTINTVTVVFIAFNPVQARGDVFTSGYFNGSNCSLSFVIANTIGLGDTDGGPFPANYPALLDTSCGATRANGSWGNINQITMRIDCVVPTVAKTWSDVKALYR